MKNKFLTLCLALVTTCASTFGAQSFHPSAGTEEIGLSGLMNGNSLIELAGVTPQTVQTVTVSTAAALKAAASSATNGQTIQVTEGVYDLGGDTVTLAEGVNLVGLGTAGVTLKNGHIDASAGNSIIENLIFDRDAAPTLYQTSHAGLSLTDTTMRMGMKNRERSILADSHVLYMSATDEGWRYSSGAGTHSDDRKANLHLFLKNVAYTNDSDNSNDAALTDFLSDYAAWNVYDIKYQSGSGNDASESANTSTTAQGSIFVKVKAHSGSDPFVQVYTHPQDNAGDRASWYRSRITYYASTSTNDWADAKTNGDWVVLYLGAQPTNADFPDAIDGTEVFVPLVAPLNVTQTVIAGGSNANATDIETAEQDVIKQFTFQNGSNEVTDYTVAAAGYKFDHNGTERKNQVILQKANPDADYIVAGQDTYIENCTFHVRNEDAKNQYAASAITTVYNNYSGLRVDGCEFNGYNSNGGIGIILNPINDAAYAPQITNCTFNNLGSGIMADAHATDSNNPILIKGCNFTNDVDATLENIGISYPSAPPASLASSYIHIEGYTSTGTIPNNTSTIPNNTSYDDAFLATLNHQGNEINVYYDAADITMTANYSGLVGPIGKSVNPPDESKDLTRFISHFLDTNNKPINDNVIAANAASGRIANTSAQSITARPVLQAQENTVMTLLDHGFGSMKLRSYTKTEENGGTATQLPLLYTDLKNAGTKLFDAAPQFLPGKVVKQAFADFSAVQKVDQSGPVTNATELLAAASGANGGTPDMTNVAGVDFQDASLNSLNFRVANLVRGDFDAINSVATSNGTVDATEAKAALQALFDSTKTEYYYVLGSTRSEGRDKESKLFMTRVLSDLSAGIDTAFLGADGGSVDLTSGLSTVYTADGIAQYRFEDVVVDEAHGFAYVVGTIQEDVQGRDMFTESFVGVINLADGSWKMNAVETTNGDYYTCVARNGANLYVGGYNATGAFVAQYAINNTSAPTSLTLNSGYNNNEADQKTRAVAVQSDGKIVFATAHEVSVTPTLIEQVSVSRLYPNGTLDTDFAGSGVRTVDFDAVPQMSPLSYSPAFPEFEYENKHMQIEIGSDNEIFVVGTLAAHGLPFVYKLNNNGAELEYSKNFSHDVNTNNDLVQALVDSPIMYPVVGHGWAGAVHGVYASAIDTENNWLYLFGGSGEVNRSSDLTKARYSNLDVSADIRRVTTGNLTIAADVNKVKIEALYSENSMTLQVIDGNAEAALNAAEPNMTFENFKLYSNKETITTTGAFTMDVYGTVKVTRKSLGAAQPSIEDEVVVLSTATGTNAASLGLHAQRSSEANELRLTDGSGNIFDDHTDPTTANSGITAGTLVGTMNDGTVLELSIEQIELVDEQLIADLWGNLPITLTNHYNQAENGYQVSINVNKNLPLPLNLVNELTEYDETYNNNVSSDQATLQEVKLDVIETEGADSMPIFGYIVMGTTTPVTIPVSGNLAVTVADNKVTKFTENSLAAMDYNPADSYIQGRNKDMRVTLGLVKSDDLAYHNIRSAATVTCDARLVASNAAGTVSVTDVQSVSNVTSDFTIADTDITITDVTRKYTRGGQHKIRVKGTVKVNWDNCGLEDTTVPVGGDFVFKLSSDLSTMTPQKKFVLSGSLQESNSEGDAHGLVQVQVRISDVVEPS